jgi:aminomethyltransferase
MIESTSEGAGAHLLRTPLYALHRELGARMCPFAGWDMPISFSSGIVAEHLHTRRKASLFDVSHMGQALVAGRNATIALEALTPADLRDLPPGRARYTFLLSEDGNILDDLIVTRLAPLGEAERFFIVVNAANKTADFALLRERAPDLHWADLEGRALIAVQGPAAAALIGKRFPQVAEAPFMSTTVVEAHGEAWFLSRSGYTGEDGFEISTPARFAMDFATDLLSEPDLLPAGLGARDTLRLEAGLCLHGHDIDATTTPVEAALEWAIPLRRRLEGGFPGSDRVRLQIDHGPSRRRVGLLLAGRQPVREGADVFTPSGLRVGHVTSGGFGPSVGRAIAMGYVDAAHAQVGLDLHIEARGKLLPAAIVPLPFTPKRPRASPSAS